MFYAHFVLSKKGPLARIWLAAHWDKKLTRSQVFETNITSSVEAILEPKVKLALRTSGHLLLGVVRIHSRQAKYLLSDCNEAFVKIKMAFRPGADLTDETHRDSTALAAITLSDNIHDFESTLADINDMDPFGIAVNQSRPEDITMREEFGEPNLGRPDDDFGDSTFEDAGDRDFVGEHINMDSMEDHNEADMTLTNELVKNQSTHVFPEMPSSVGIGNNDSEFGDVMDVDYDDSESVENLENMFQDTVNQVADSISGVESRLIDSTLDNNNNNNNNNNDDEVDNTTNVDNTIDNTLDSSTMDNNSVIVEVAELPTVPEEESIVLTVDMPVQQPPTSADIVSPQQRRQLPHFVLPPIDRSIRENRRVPKRKRKLLIDEHKSIPSDVMKMQMQDTSEITTRLDLAPPTRKLMLWKETGNVEALFTTPGRAIPSRILQKLFYRNMKTVTVPNDSPDGLPVIPGVRRCGGFLNYDEDMVGLVTGDMTTTTMTTTMTTTTTTTTTSAIGTKMGDLVSTSTGPLTMTISLSSLPPQVSLSEHKSSVMATTPVTAPATPDSRDHHRDMHQHDLCNISEATNETDQHEEHHMPEGACSSYSTNYYGWSGHATPQHDGDDDQLVGFNNDDAVHNSSFHVSSLSVTVANSTGGGDNGGGGGGGGCSGIIDQSVSVVASPRSVMESPHTVLHTSFSDNYRPSVATSITSMANDAMTAASSFDRSIEKARGATIDSIVDRSSLLAYPMDDMSMSGAASMTDFGSSMVASDQSGGMMMQLLVPSVPLGGDRMGLTDTQNKLQTTMVMLDQQLDKVNEEYPVEITQEGLEKRSEIMLNMLRNAIKREGQVDFHHLTVSNNKKQAASKFYTLLLLGKQKKLQMCQETPYSNIIITKVDSD